MIRKLELNFENQKTSYAVIGSAVNLLMNNQADVLIIRNAVKSEDCNMIANNFYHSSAVLPRTDNVPGIMVGVSHYFKEPSDYYQHCEQTYPDVCGLFENIKNPILALYKGIEEACRATVRPAHFQQKKALFTRGIQWPAKDNQEYMLQPHDDVCQVFCDRNKDWEVNEIQELFAVNFYAKSARNEGKLRIFDFYPDDCFLKENPALIGNGYPYPKQILNDADYEDVSVGMGDIVILNGKFVHAVTAGTGNRLVLNSFIGSKKDNNEIIYWT